MTEEQKVVWVLLQDLELNEPSSSFTFSDRLARENGWSLDYSLKAIDEYKKFIFLIKFSGHPCTPSDEIDQVWHLHLLYTQSYWKDMCRDILNTEIHHGPTKGIEQRGDFKEYYTKTLESYIKFYNSKPPKNIWPSLKKRFSNVNFQRVNLHTHKIKKKWI